MGRADHTLAPHRQRDERNRGARRAPYHHGLAPSRRDDGSRQNRREDPQYRRQTHQRRHGQTVGQRDQRRDYAAREVAEESGPSVSQRASQSSARELSHAITLRNAVLNLFISSCVPTDTRTWFGMLGHTRPT